jgi:hypothetical protein
LFDGRKQCFTTRPIIFAPSRYGEQQGRRRQKKRVLCVGFMFKLLW